MLYDELYKEISETLVYKPTNGFYRINCNRQPEENYKADPYLVFTDSPLLSELGRVVNLMDCPLIICDSFNFPTISKLYPAQTKLIEDNFQETVKEILLLKNKNKSNSLIGLGGCTALDVAREVAGGSNLVFFPTILSTKCLTVNLSILRDKDHNEYNSVTRPPNLTVISFPYFEKLDPDLSRFWAVSCLGDVFAEIGAVCDEAARENKLVNEMVLSEKVPTSWGAVEFFDTEKIRFNARDTIEKISVISHLCSLEVIRNNTKYRGGGEHKLYYALKKLPQARLFPPHGQIVALGTLMTLKGYSEITGDEKLFRRLLRVLKEIGLFVSLKDIEDNYNITRDVISQAAHYFDDHKWPSIIGDYFRRGDFLLFNRVFSDPETGNARL